MRLPFSPAVNQIALASLFFTLLILAYWAALSGPFLLDDFSNLPQAKPEALSLGALLEASQSNASGPLGRPLSTFTFGLNYLLTGDNPLGFKVVNLIIHAANTCLVFHLIRTLATQARCFTTALQLQPYHLALAVTFLWALHPLHMSTVMYVVQRMSLLSAFFVLLSTICYVKARLTYCTTLTVPLGTVTAALIFGISAVYSKENGALVIVYLALLEWLILRHHENRVRWSKTKCSMVVALAGMIALIGLHPVMSLLKGQIEGYEFRHFSLYERILTQPVVLVDYLGQTLWPRVTQMGLYFDDTQVVQSWNFSLLFSVFILSLLLLVFVLCIKRNPMVSLGIGLFMASHLMESTVLPLELKFEHRNYLGSVGIIVAAVSVIGTLPEIIRHRVITYSLFLAATLVLSAQTFGRSHTWKDELSLNSHEVQRAPESKRARSALAISLSKVGKTTEALAQVQATISLHPDDTYAPIQLFQICALASSDCQEELDNAIRAVSSGSITMDTVLILDDLSANNRAGRIKGLSQPDLAEIISVVANNPDSSLPDNYKARLQLILSEALLGSRQYKKATSAVKQSAALDPSNVDLLMRAAEITAGIGSIEDAEQMLSLLSYTASAGFMLSERALAVKRHVERRRETQ